MAARTTTAPAESPEQSYISPPLRAFIEAERRRSDVVGVGVAAFDADGLRYASGFGYADLQRGEAVTASTLFRAASITKLFTTALVLQELEAGRVGLDDPVSQHFHQAYWIRDRTGSPAPVTVRHLLSHTSGLPVSWRGLESVNPLMRVVMNGAVLPHSLEGVVRGQRAVRAPGKRIVYANGGFNLLGLLVSMLNGRPYRDLLKERVLEPLAMRSSDVPVFPEGAGRATPYGGSMNSAGRKPAPAVRNYGAPAGALITSAEELSRFGRMVLRGGELDGRRLLAADSLSQATRMQARNHPELDEGLGLGFWVSTWRGRRIAHHDGGLPGVATRIALAPDDRVGIVVLSNGGDAGFVHRVADRMLEDAIGLEPEPIPGSPSGVPAGSEKEWRAFTERVTGRYRLLDVFPPGLPTMLFSRVARPRLTRAGGDVLAVEGVTREPAFIYPDGPIGRYRAAYPLASGTRVVIEERKRGTHIWASILHLFKPRR
ncbi:MAG: beta-lactamase family protein [Chloroflexi bacterium]|nr:MAG: beta-lactamase family protein [Chloroflexota bacterium]